jgi:hypothetical protein
MVGVVCDNNSFLATYAPECVKSVPIGENDEQKLVGMIVKKELTCEYISLINFDKNKIIENFNHFKGIVNQVAHPEEFNSQEEHSKWLEEFNNSEIEIAVVVI